MSGARSRAPRQATAARIAGAFEAACLIELDALKPGNVHRYADGHGMVVAQFEASARAAAPAIARPGAAVGARVLEAVQASIAVAACNTNLGIVLLCAPLARAAQDLPAAAPSDAQAGGVAALARATAAVLAALDLDDARQAFRAIALANPGGLGHVDRHDVHAAPELDLRSAMVAAAGRDRIARQYACDFKDLFEISLPALRRRLDAGALAATAVGALYLELLARWPDTHIVRKFGDTVAQSVSEEAQRILRQMTATNGAAASQTALLGWDARLKSQGINPGTTADLTVATVFAHLLTAPPGS